jgi:AcrR family transcriptional regulator
VASGRNSAAAAAPDLTPHPEEILFPEGEHASMRRLLLAALDTFSELGYHGTATRDITRRANVSAGALYTHFESKQAMLELISRVTHEAMLVRMRAARDAGGPPTECLSRIVHEHVRFHATYNTACRVANYELHSLIPKHRARMRKLRQQMEDIVLEVLEEGITTGEFEVVDQQLVSMYILSLGIDVSRWFRPAHRLTPDVLADQYSHLVLRSITAPGRPAAARGRTGHRRTTAPRASAR